jgi:Protein of unknown function (DUF3037)
MPAAELGPRPFTYALLRVVPRVERGERLNAGVVLFSREYDYLGMRAEVDEARMAALAPDLDLGPVHAHIAALCRVASGDPEAGALARLPPSERFGWLVSPSSTIIQPSEVHTGLTSNPEATLGHLFEKLVVPTPHSAGGRDVSST